MAVLSLKCHCCEWTSSDINDVEAYRSWIDECENAVVGYEDE